MEAELSKISGKTFEYEMQSRGRHNLVEALKKSCMAPEVLKLKVGAKVMIDGAQSVVHFAIDVKKLDCDFYCFSAHKLYGPTGVGVLYGKAELLEAMPPYRGGGEMIHTVSFNGTTYNEIPHKFGRIILI